MLVLAALIVATGLATVPDAAQAGHRGDAPRSLRAPAQATIERFVAVGLPVRLRAAPGTRSVVLSLRRRGRDVVSRRFRVRRGGELRLRWKLDPRSAARVRPASYRLGARTGPSRRKLHRGRAQRTIELTRAANGPRPVPTPAPAPAQTPPGSPPPAEPTPPSPPPPPSEPVVVAAAGDIACPSVCGQDETADLITETIKPHAVLGLGDYQYDFGTAENFARYYHPFWGRFRDRTYPINGGSHDFYGTGDYLGYFNAGGPRALEPEASYSFDLGEWHFIALNSYCFQRASCDESAWTEWLRRDLQAHPTGCTVAYFHQPYWTTPSNHSRTTALKPWVRLLHEHGVELLLQAHNHTYERFAPQTPDDVRDDATGIVAFVVGTGGRSHYASSGAPAPNSVVRSTGTYGVLELVLRPGRYDFRFVPEPGKTFTDRGSGACR